VWVFIYAISCSYRMPNSLRNLLQGFSGGHDNHFSMSVGYCYERPLSSRIGSTTLLQSSRSVCFHKNSWNSMVWGCVIAQAVSRWLPTAAARVRAWVWSSGICGRKSGDGAGFLRVPRFPPAKLHSPKFSIIIIIRGRYNRPFSGRRAEWTQLGLHPPTMRI
jgi:hypothetical protein